VKAVVMKAAYKQKDFLSIVQRVLGSENER